MYFMDAVCSMDCQHLLQTNTHSGLFSHISGLFSPSLLYFELVNFVCSDFFNKIVDITAVHVIQETLLQELSSF